MILLYKSRMSFMENHKVDIEPTVGEEVSEELWLKGKGGVLRMYCPHECAMLVKKELARVFYSQDDSYVGEKSMKKSTILSFKVDNELVPISILPMLCIGDNVNLDKVRYVVSSAKDDIPVLSNHSLYREDDDDSMPSLEDHDERMENAS